MVKFGPSGNDILFYDEGHKHSSEAFEWVKNRGLDLYEYSLARNVYLKEETALQFYELSKKYGIEISVHAPYYINLANESEEAIEKNIAYIIRSLQLLKIMGGKKCVVHLASQGTKERNEALRITKNNLLKVLEKIYEYKLDDLFLCPETMGKYVQIGNHEEIINFCKLDKCLIPTFDFGHLNCLMQGKLNNEEEYEKIIKLCNQELGEFKTNNMHIHFSKIEFSSKGEIRHLTLDDTKFGPPFEPLAKVLKNYKIENATIISESREIMAQDALRLKKMFYKQS